MLIHSLVLIDYIFLFFLFSYICWGFVVGFEVVLAMSGAEFAKEWLKKHYTYKRLVVEVLFFYPMIYLAYFFLEIIPYYLLRAQRPCLFDLKKLYSSLFFNKKN